MAEGAKSSPVAIRDEVVALKRERTVEAAVTLFYENGYENATLDAVAELLGVTKPFIYAHFNSKTDLLAEICSRGIESSLQAIDSVIPLQLSAATKLRLLAVRFATAVLKNRMHIAIFSREEKNLTSGDFKRINEMRHDFDRKLGDLLRAGVENREFALSDPSMAALSIGGMVSWAYIWYRPTGRLSLEEVADTMAELIVQMATSGVCVGVPKE